MSARCLKCREPFNRAASKSKLWCDACEPPEVVITKGRSEGKNEVTAEPDWKEKLRRRRPDGKR